MPSKKPIWPEYWKLEELEGVKASLSTGKWNAQWMQNPTSEEGSIIKREHAPALLDSLRLAPSVGHQ